MPKSRKRKNLNKDFQKVKLKVGKSLPRADNVTNTSFKSGTIQLKDQLKPTTSGPTTKRKQSILDLLSQLEHYNASVRHDALVGLKELDTNFPDVLAANLGTLVERVSTLFVDKDPVVRQATVKLLKQLFQHISPDQISAFFPILVAHLRCAMTHIYDDIQRDSLNVLDVCLDYYPHLMSSDASKLVQNFLEQISWQQNKDKKKSRSLNIKPSGGSTQKWRTKVLARLHKLLLSLKSSHDTSSQSADCNAEQTTVRWSHSQPVYHQPHSCAVNTHRHKVFNLSSSGSGFASSDSSSSLVSSWNGLQSLMTSLVPLLIECWMESENDHMDNRKEGTLSPEALHMKTAAVKLLELLWQQADEMDTKDNTMDWLRENYAKDFIKHFLERFPFSCSDGFVPRKRKMSVEEEESLICSLNMGICKVMSFFMSSSQFPMNDVARYARDIFRYKKLSAQECVEYIVIAKRLLKTQHAESILQAVYDSYKKSHDLSAERRLYLKDFLADLVLGNEGFKYSSNPIVTDWVESLPTLLVTLSKVDAGHKTTAVTLDIIHQMASRKNNLVLQNFQKLLPQLFDPDNGLFANSSAPSQRKILEIVFCVEKIDVPLAWKNIMLSLRSEKVDSEVIDYCIQVLHHRCVRRLPDDVEERTMYISLLLSLVCGYTSNELSQFSSRSCMTSQSFNTLTSDSRLVLWKRQLFITQCACHSLLQFSDQPAVGQVMCALLARLLGSALPASVTLSILWALTRLCQHLSLTSIEGVLTLRCRDLLVHTYATIAIADDIEEINAFRSQCLSSVSEFLEKQPHITALLLALLKDDLNQGLSDSDVKLYCQTLLYLIRDTDVKANVTLVKEIIGHIERSHCEVLDQQILADLKYSTSLIK